MPHDDIYTGRFAPSPTGPLHAGSLVAALASWLDARAQGGRWLVRIEDVDTPRCIPGMARVILDQLAACGLVPDAPPLVQSQRSSAYQDALDRLVATGLAYPCGCSRRDIEIASARLGHPRQRHAELVYPGTCRQGLQGRAARAWRLNVEKCETRRHPAEEVPGPSPPLSIANGVLGWYDRRLGAQQQDVGVDVGDFVLKRADGLWAYQLAVVVDDGAQGVTHVVRGADLADNTPRQILLQRALGLPTPAYLHTPLVLGDNGEKLSKQNSAQALDCATPQAALQALQGAAAALGLPAAQVISQGDALRQWTDAWRQRYGKVSRPV